MLFLKKIFQRIIRSSAAAYVKENRWLWAVLLYSILLHFTECLCYYLGKINFTIGNPFLQGLWSCLALFGIGMLAGGRIAKVILSLLLVLQSLEAAVSIFLSLIFSLTLRADAFAVLEVSSVQEITEFCSMFLKPKVIFCILAGIAVLALVLTALWKSSIKRTVYLFTISGILILPQLINTIRFTVNGDYEDIYYQNSLARLTAEILDHRKSIDDLSKMMHHPQLPAEIRSVSADKDFTAVLVIGESATRFHHSIYGYPRNTSPLLNEIKDELLIFTDVISGIAHTVQSCLYMFTTEDKQNFQDYRYTMFDVFKAAGFKIYLFSNQARWGKFDSPIGIITAHADKRVYIQEEKPASLDDYLLTKLDSVLHEKGKKLIVLHLIGSHARYENRSTASFKLFSKKNRIETPYSVDDWEEIDEYDNSILFTDHVLRQVADRVKSSAEPSFMLYCPDHGDLPEQGTTNPRSASSKIPEHYEIPFVFYANPVYRNKFPDLLNAAGKNIDKPYMTDQLMFSMFSAARITFAGFPFDKDLFSPKFVPPSIRKLGNSQVVYQSRGNPYSESRKNPPAKK